MIRIALGLATLSCLLSSNVYAAPGHLTPENGSPLRLVLVEDNNDLPQKLSDGGLIGSAVVGVLGASALSWWSHSSDTELYAASALADMALAVGVTNALTFALKSSLQRARPYTYSANYPGTGDKAYTQYQQDDAFHSFPSGHTSNTAAFMFSLATTAAFHLPEMTGRSWMVGGLYALATASTLTVAEMRVQGGYHFYSDVFTGGFIGLVAGVLVPYLHHKLVREFVEPTQTVSMGLSVSQRYQVLALQGSF